MAREAGWQSTKRPGKWMPITRTFRDGSTQSWWALEIIAGPYGPDKTERAIVATTDPETLPDQTTWYLVTNLPAPTEHPAMPPSFPPASLEEVVRLYGLRQWVEQSYKQIKHATSMVPVPGQKRPSHSTALAIGVVRLLLLLVSCFSPLLEGEFRAKGAV